MVNNFENYFIGPDEVNNELRGSMLDFLSYPFLPGENIVCERIEELGCFQYKRTQISNWTEFEIGEQELDQALFFKVFLNDLNIGQTVLLITDEGIMKKIGFKFKVSEFYLFSDQYEDFFSMEFFQLSFYLIAIPSMNMIRYLDECGGINEYTIL